MLPNLTERRPLLVLALTAFSLCLCSPAQKTAPASKSASPISTAKAHLDQGNIDSAESTLWTILAAEPNIAPILDLITTWIHIGQALVGSVGALAFIFAFIWKITAVESKSALAAKQWIQRIVVGTIGVEVASSLVTILTDSVPASPTH